MPNFARCAYAIWQAANLLDSATDEGFANTKPASEKLEKTNSTLRDITRECEISTFAVIAKIQDALADPGISRVRLGEARTELYLILREQAEGAS